MRTVKNSKRKRFLAGRGRLLGVGLLGAAGALALLAAILGTGSESNVPQSASATIERVPETSDSSTISAISSSVAIAKDPLKASSTASASKTGSATGSKTTGDASRSSSSTSADAAGGPSGSATGDSTSSADSGSGSGLITTGDSKVNCITLDFPSGAMDQSTITAATSLTGVTYNCISMFANPVATWALWEAPWMFQDPQEGWDAWLAANPDHQAVVGMDLIPQSVSNNDDPLTWEQPCASGDYNEYATALAENLVSYGAGSVVIRLGVEANGTWEDDYVGSTTTEMSDWAKCFDNEVAAMRAVSGTNFLFVWNPNLCVADLPLDEWYPGNSYVDIIGVDAYDQDCSTLETVSQEGWAAYSTDSNANPSDDPNFPSLANFETFATSNGKPLSFPEWGIYDDMPDDSTYVGDMAQMFNDDDFSFESYFDTDGSNIAALGSEIPNATAAYSQALK